VNRILVVLLVCRRAADVSGGGSDRPAESVFRPKPTALPGASVRHDHGQRLRAGDLRTRVRADEAPKLAAHQDAIFLNASLFARVKSLYDRRATLGLDAQATYLLERYYRNFVRAGAELSEADKSTLRAVFLSVPSGGRALRSPSRLTPRGQRAPRPIRRLLLTPNQPAASLGGRENQAAAP
jgi:hypothetical protein